MKKTMLILLVVATIGLLGWVLVQTMAPASTSDGPEDTNTERSVVAMPASAMDEITVTVPGAEQVISSPLTISGEAIGPWYFEGSFPVALLDWNGVTLVESYVTAQTDWMTMDSVQFTTDITFVSPYHAGDPAHMQQGTLVLRRDNPSGLPENDASIAIPVLFAPAP